MELHTKEFTVNGQKTIMGHDRETGKRCYIDVFGIKTEVKSINLTEFVEGENYISIGTGLDELILFSDMENPEKVLEELKAIFWIK